MILHGDCIDKLKELEPNSVDSIVTDPPYGLSFMGKKWDYDVPSVDIWKECYRVLKPGGYLLSFAGTRTQHRMAVNIEDAGFEIRDMIAWVYGSGFPKSLNIGKAVDKLQGNERESLGLAKGAGAGMSDNLVAINKGLLPEYEATKGNSEWEGWGTALKPALEPITVARKPLGEKTVAENVLKWGTGGINIDGSRVGTDEVITNHSRGSESAISKGKYGDSSEQETHQTEGQQLGRFPANLIHDGSDEVTDLLNDSARFFYCAKASKADRDEGLEGFESKQLYYDDRRGSSFDVFVKRDDDGKPLNPPRKNSHPTVKPTKLMQYLVKLVTPKGGVVLDPFMGSGSTGKACKLEGFEFIGIEREAEYIEIAKARINVISQPTLDII